MKAGILYIVSTPIGNREDITLRAIETLKSADLVAAEDTRHSQKLLDFYGITTPSLSLHDYNESARAGLLSQKLQAGENIALISDAGTPLISDPGYRLVTTVRAAGISVIPIPGACAAIAALVASGLPTDRFVFEGFLPQKGAVRKKRLEALKEESRTLIFYESVHRIVDLMNLLDETLGGDRPMALARELTKIHETIYSATVSEIKKYLSDHPEQHKGEFVVVVAGAKKVDADPLLEEYRLLLKTLLSELSLKQAVSLAVKITNASKKKLYALALEITRR